MVELPLLSTFAPGVHNLIRCRIHSPRRTQTYPRTHTRTHTHIQINMMLTATFGLWSACYYIGQQYSCGYVGTECDVQVCNVNETSGEEICWN